MMDIIAGQNTNQYQTAEEKDSRRATIDNLSAALGGEIQGAGYHKPSPFAMALRDTNPVIDDQQGDDFHFTDIIDMVNPLQHIPLVNTAYREFTGDDIRPVSRLIGGAVFGGPLGAAASMVNIAVENETGRDVTQNALFMLRPSSKYTAGDALNVANAYQTAQKPHIERLTQNAYNHQREPITRINDDVIDVEFTEDVSDMPYIIRMSSAE